MTGPMRRTWLQPVSPRSFERDVYDEGQLRAAISDAYKAGRPLVAKLAQNIVLSSQLVLPYGGPSITLAGLFSPGQLSLASGVSVASLVDAQTPLVAFDRVAFKASTSLAVSTAGVLELLMRDCLADTGVFVDTSGSVPVIVDLRGCIFDPTSAPSSSSSTVATLTATRSLVVQGCSIGVSGISAKLRTIAIGSDYATITGCRFFSNVSLGGTYGTFSHNVVASDSTKGNIVSDATQGYSAIVGNVCDNLTTSGGVGGNILAANIVTGAKTLHTTAPADHDDG